MALALLLEKRAGVEARVGYGGIIGRAENLALREGAAAARQSRCRQVVFDEYDLLALVDTQPSVGNHSLPAQLPGGRGAGPPPAAGREPRARRSPTWAATIGATSTMLVEYLRAARLEPSVEVATALFYGIKTDSRDLGRQTTPADVDSYLWLFPRVDKHLLGRIEHPDLPARVLPAVPLGDRAGAGSTGRRW